METEMTKKSNPVIARMVKIRNSVGDRAKQANAFGNTICAVIWQESAETKDGRLMSNSFFNEAIKQGFVDC
jgi:hypothetical protein